MQFPTPGGLPDPGIKPASSAQAGAFFTTVPPGNTKYQTPLFLSTPQVAVRSKRQCIRKYFGDFPGGLVVKNLPCSAGDIGSILGQGTKIIPATEQLTHKCGVHTLQQKIAHEAGKSCKPQPKPQADKYFSKIL